MNLTEFDFELPEELIATRPVSPRSSARLLVSNGEGIADRSVANLLDYLGPKDRLVLNDTKVIPARLFTLIESLTSVYLCGTKSEESP